MFSYTSRLGVTKQIYMICRASLFNPPFHVGDYTPHPYIYTFTPTFNTKFQFYPLYKIKHKHSFTCSTHHFSGNLTTNVHSHLLMENIHQKLQTGILGEIFPNFKIEESFDLNNCNLESRINKPEYKWKGFGKFKPWLKCIFYLSFHSSLFFCSMDLNFHNNNK